MSTKTGLAQLALAPAPLTSLPPWTAGLTDTLHLYYTNGVPTLNGLDTFTISQRGVQPVTVSAAHPLLLFDLDVSLEWDASNDPGYLEQLEFDLKQASRYLYDFSDGQVALGQVTVHQNGEAWDTAHVVIRATNRLRPFAIQGGLVLTETVDPQHSDILYDIGQVTMGATWNRYGNAGQNLGQDWPLALAHELSHFLLFMDDTYLGLNQSDLLIPLDSCAGSAMSDVYAPDNTEFVGDGSWLPSCANTLANKTLHRSEWATLRLWYPWLNAPASPNSGPGLMPFDLTTVTILPPQTTTNTLADPTFYLDYVNGAVSSSEGQGFLLRGEQIINLGSPAGGQNRLLARGAQPGDRLCLFDPARRQYGCESIAVGDERLQLEQDDAWTPLLTLSPVNSTTFTLKVEALLGGLTLKARLYPEGGPVSNEITLVETTPGVYNGTLRLAEVALAGHIWLGRGNPAQREAIVAFSIGGNPPKSRGGGPKSRGGGPKSRGGGAPLVSPDGQMIFFTPNPLVFDEGDFYTIQNMAGLPPLPPGKKAIGPSYNLVATPGAPLISGSVSFQYLGFDVMVEGMDENSLTIHYWNGQDWRALSTVRSPYYNMASAPSQGPGVYALLGGVTTPLINTVIPAAATNEVTTTLVISGGYFLPPVAVALMGPTATYTLPVTSVSSFSLTAVVTAGLPAQEYPVRVVNGDGGVSPVSGLFALYSPENACFYDFFESGPSKWQLSGTWNITSLPDGRQMMSDSPAGPYQNAGDYALDSLTYTTAITSIPFSLVNCPNPLLLFDQAYAIIPPGDLGRVEISMEGAAWQTLATYANSSSLADIEPQQGLEWANVSLQPLQLSLSAYTGTVRLRFSLTADEDVSAKGWVLDNVRVISATTASAFRVFLPLITKGEATSPPVSGPDLIIDRLEVGGGITVTLRNAGTANVADPF